MFALDWPGMMRIVIVGIVAYLALVILLRVSGKRTLSKLNAFDFVITIAIGSTLSAVILDSAISLPEGILALSLLIFLQYIFTWTSYRSKVVNNWIKAEPQLVYFQGRYLRKAMKKERVQRIELLQASRRQGIESLEQVEAIVLETDGNLSVIKKSDKLESDSSLANVNGFKENK